MYHAMKRQFGALAAILICAAVILGSAYLPASCTLTPEQQQRIHAISVPATAILSKAAVSQGWIRPGDEIIIQRGVAVVTSPGDAETKIFQLAEIGLDHAIRQGILGTDDQVKVDSASEVTITTAPPPPEATLTLPPIQPVPASPGK